MFWLLTFDSAEEALSSCVEKFYKCVAIERWLEWVPQLLTGLVSYLFIDHT